MQEALVTNKRKVVLDFNCSKDLDRLRQLIHSADVLITNFSAATLEKFGLDAASCAALRPGLVYVWLPGFASADETLASAPPAAWEAIIMASAGVFRDMGVNRQLMSVEASYSPLPLASSARRIEHARCCSDRAPTT